MNTKAQMLRALIREEVKRQLNSKPVNEGFFSAISNALKSLLGKQKQEAKKITQQTGKRIVGMDFDGYYIDENGNRV